MSSKLGTVVFFDLPGFSLYPDPDQAEVVQSFINTLRGVLRQLWPQASSRNQRKPYFVLETGDGAAIVIWDAAPKLRGREITAIWIASKILHWAQNQNRLTGIRCGINSGELDLITGLSGGKNVCGATINDAQRIMDAAQPGQMLAGDTFTQRLPPEYISSKGKFRFQVESAVFEALAKHGKLLRVRSITGRIASRGGSHSFGLAQPPANKWHLQIEPPSDLIKIPPLKLLLRHRKIAFVGATNDQLPKIFVEAIQSDPQKHWQDIIVFFLKDRPLHAISFAGRRDRDLVRAKRRTIRTLRSLLSRYTGNLQFREYSHPYYFASYWDWDAPGGRIHISPYIWGADIRTCPSLDYTWITSTPTQPYKAYGDGLNRLLRESTLVQLHIGARRNK